MTMTNEEIRTACEQAEASTRDLWIACEQAFNTYKRTMAFHRSLIHPEVEAARAAYHKADKEHNTALFAAGYISIKDRLNMAIFGGK